MGGGVSEYCKLAIAPFANNDFIPPSAWQREGNAPPHRAGTRSAYTNDCMEERVNTLLSYIFGDLDGAKTQKLSDATLEERS